MPLPSASTIAPWSSTTIAVWFQCVYFAEAPRYRRLCPKRMSRLVHSSPCVRMKSPGRGAPGATWIPSAA